MMSSAAARMKPSVTGVGMARMRKPSRAAANNSVRMATISVRVAASAMYAAVNGCAKW
jgi:hypothetical protein